MRWINSKAASENLFEHWIKQVGHTIATGFGGKAYMLVGSLRQFATLFFFALISSSLFLWAEDVKPEDVIAKHLDAIGTAQARKDVKSRVVQGAATYRILAGGSGTIDGKFVVASEGQKSDMVFKVVANAYLGEQFIYDGNRTSVSGSYNDKTRSEFGFFVYNQDLVLRENLLGGVWLAGWPLLDLDGHHSKVLPAGTKNIDGKELIVLRYQPKKTSDMDILLFFDPQTYQHVMTTYKMERSIGITGGETAQAGKSAPHYELVERFSDFQTAGGLTLPRHYDVRYTMETDRGFTKSVEWEVKALNIMNNLSIDPRSFQPK